ncbi:helicase associated domain-containing protein [Streptomyces sp. NPDC006703]|uniref:helicase associated domain-containing protein n=1 Tax=Streptomyces sp. NPDC006703 TaxID=3364759 RepID=UPI0036D1502D
MAVLAATHLLRHPVTGSGNDVNSLSDPSCVQLGRALFAVLDPVVPDASAVPRRHTRPCQDGSRRLGFGPWRLHRPLGRQDHDVRLGVRVPNQKSRRDKLNADQLAQLAALGIDWA